MLSTVEKVYEKLLKNKHPLLSACQGYKGICNKRLKTANLFDYVSPSRSRFTVVSLKRSPKSLRNLFILSGIDICLTSLEVS